MNDQFDASLVLLRRRFCWSYLDIFYQTYVVRNSSQLDLSPEAEARLLSKQENLGEKLLYDKLNATWWNSPELTQDDFWKEVGLCMFVPGRRGINMVTLSFWECRCHGAFFRGGRRRGATVPCSQGNFFLKQGLKQDLPVHIVKIGWR